MFDTSFQSFIHSSFMYISGKGQQVEVLLPAATLWAKFQRQRFGDKGKDSLFKIFTILE